MDRDSKYSLISVGTDDEEEIVIQAGAPVSPVLSDAGKNLERSASVSKPADADLPLGEGVAERAVDPIEGHQGVHPSALTEDALNQQSNDSQKSTNYYETTKEDLDSVSPMSNTQKAVIICALLLIVGFVLYYLFLR